ncbi:MAG: hypothetical protein M3Y82_07535, partial [Verrucomicrobiota bacterium]|nr:hypothetical protein [Verrucomicrobiota bacterium]
ATAATLTVSNAQTNNDSGAYVVEVMNSTSCTTASNPAILTVGSVVSPSSLTITKNPNNTVTITWSTPSSTLQSAPVVTGPYTDVPGATSPYTTSSASGQAFYRLRN